MQLLISVYWNASERVEEWRAAWAECCNARLTEQNQIDHRSYIRQGIDQQPTIHEGYTARKIAAAGHESDRVQANAEIRERNRLLRALVSQIKAIGEKIAYYISVRNSEAKQVQPPKKAFVFSKERRAEIAANASRAGKKRSKQQETLDPDINDGVSMR